MLRFERNLLKQKNRRYAEICFELERYQEYNQLYRLYFCKKVEQETDEIKFILNEDKVEENKRFIEKWREREQAIKRRLNKNSYFSISSKRRDKDDLRKGQQKYHDLIRFYEYEEMFKDLEEKIKRGEKGGDVKTLSDYLISIDLERQAIEDEEEKKTTKTEQKSSQPGE